MAIPILPDAPSRTDPVNFSTKADAWVSALGPWTTAANQLELSLQQSATTATSTTSISIGLGDKGFGIPTGKSFIIGSYVYIVASADISKVMYGQITSYSGGGTLSVNVSYTQGSGTFSNWNIGLSVPRNGNENFNSLRVGNLYPSTTPYTWFADLGTVHLGGNHSDVQNTLFSHNSSGSGWASNTYLDLTGTWRYQYVPWGAGLMTVAQDEFQWYGAAYNTNPSNPAVSWQQTFGVNITHGPYRLNDASTANGLVRKSQMDSVMLNTVPIGTILDYGGETVPYGYLECNGVSLNRDGVYAPLFAVIGTLHGSYGPTVFSIPDLRGKFKRTWAHGLGSDPDRLTRGGPAGGSTGDRVGSTQGWQIQSHDHPTVVDSGQTGVYGVSSPWYTVATRTTASPTGATGGNQTNPTNVYVMSIIKVI